MVNSGVMYLHVQTYSSRETITEINIKVKWIDLLISVIAWQIWRSNELN